MLKFGIVKITLVVRRFIKKLKKMKNLLITLLILNSYIATSQEIDDISLKSDLSLTGGVALSENTFGRIGLMYRKPINNSLRLKFSGNFSKFYSFTSLNDVTLHSSDSLIILRNREVYNQNFTVKFGIDKTLYNFINIGLDLNLGYSKESIYTMDDGIEFNPSTNQWETCSTCVYEYHGNEVDNNPGNPGLPDYVRSNDGLDYFIYGLSLNAGLYQPIGNKWEIAVQYSPDLMMFQSLDGSGKMFNKIFHFADVMVRYKI